MKHRGIGEGDWKSSSWEGCRKSLVEQVPLKELGHFQVMWLTNAKEKTRLFIIEGKKVFCNRNGYMRKILIAFLIFTILKFYIKLPIMSHDTNKNFKNIDNRKHIWSTTLEESLNYIYISLQKMIFQNNIHIKR